MADVSLKGNIFHTIGNLPDIEKTLPDFRLTAGDLSDKTLKDFAGKHIVLNIFPSIDTGTCATSVKQFNKKASNLGQDTVILCISRDLPFAQSRFCVAEDLKNVITLSSLRNESFGNDYGVTFIDGPLAGLFSRSIVVADANGIIKHTEQVAETAKEPNYESVLATLKKLGVTYKL